MKIKRFLPFWLFALFIVFVQTAWAAGEAEITLEKHITGMTPVFMNGHMGDPGWIQGFTITGDIFVKGAVTKIGSFTGEISLLNPPMNVSEAYEHGLMTVLNVIPGVGSFQVTGLGLALGNSANDGVTMVSWSGSISNGTDSLQNLYGLSAGNAIVNIFTATGSMTEVLNYRIGF